MKTPLLIGLTIFLNCLSVADAAEEKRISIGLASNFSEVSTGSSNPYGAYFKDGITLALKESGANLKKANIAIDLEEFDYGTSDIKVLEATRKAISSKVLAVIGYNYSSNALLAAPLHQEAKLPMLTPSATANRLAGMGSYVHMGSFDNAFMGSTLARVARETLHAKSALILPAVNCAYCSDLADSFAKGFKSRGGVVVASLPLLLEDKDFGDIVQKAKSIQFDVVFVPNQELVSARIISALVKAGVNKPFLGADGWGNVGQEFFSILKGVNFRGYSVSHWHPDLNTAPSKHFIKEYFAAYKKMPNDTSVLAHDSMLFLIKAILSAKDLTREGIEQSLTSLRTFEAVTGKYVFNLHEAPKKSLVLLETNATKFRVVSMVHPEKVLKGRDHD